MNIKDKILKYGTFILVLLAPLVYFSHKLYPHISSKAFFIYGIVEIVVFVWIYALLTDTSYRLSKKSLLWHLPAVGFIAWMTIAGIFGANPSLSFWSSLARGTGLLTLYHCLALSVVVTSITQKFKIEYVCSLLQWFIVGAVAGAVSVWMGPGGLDLNIQALKTGGEGGLIGNSSLAAVYVLFAIVFSFFLILKKDFDKNKKKWLIAGSFVLFFSPLLINLFGLFNGYGIVGSARASIAALPVIVGFFVVFCLILHPKKNFRILGVLGGLIGIVMFAFFWVSLTSQNTLLHNKFAEVARGSRFIFWDIAALGMHKHPLLGYGPENYSIAFQENFNPDILLAQNSMEGWADRAHNVYYDIGISGGYPAVLLYGLFLVSMVCATYKVYTLGKINRIQASLLGGLLVGYVFQNLFIFDSSLSLISIFSLLGMLVGLIADSKEQVAKNKLSKSDTQAIALCLCIPFIICYLFFVHMPARKATAYAKTFSTAFGKTVPAYEKLLSGSPIGADWDAGDLAYAVYQKYITNIVALKNDKKNLPHLLNNLQALISYLYKLEETNTTDYRLYITTVYLENAMTYLTDRPSTPELTERVSGLLEKAKNLSPKNPNTYWSLAQLRVWAGDLPGTEEAYKQAILVAPHLPGSYTLLLKYAQAVGNQKLYQETLTQAQANIPGFEITN